MIRSLPKLVVALALAAGLAACGTSVMQEQTGVTGQAKARVLAFAGKQGPVLLQVSNVGFAEGRGETAAAAAEILSPMFPEVPEGFTLDPQKAGLPQYRIRLAFDPLAGASPETICAASEANPLSYDRRPARQTLFMVFCRQSVPIAAVRTKADRVDSIRDPRFREMVRQSARQMFQASASNTGSLGILTFEPEPRIKLNPVEGIF